MTDLQLTTSVQRSITNENRLKKW